LAGVFIDLFHRIAAKRESNGEVDLFRAIYPALVFRSLALWTFSAGIYFAFLRRTSAGLLPVRLNSPSALLAPV